MARFMTDGTMSSSTDLWGTPQKLFDALNREFCFDVDVCANDDNHKCKVYYTKEQDGLAQDWTGKTCFMNPPYGRDIPNWVRKAYESAKVPGGAQSSSACSPAAPTRNGGDTA